MATEACALGDARGCVFAGRLRLEGRSGARDPSRDGARDVGGALAALERGCDGGSIASCEAGAAWLGDPVHARDVPDAEARRQRMDLQQACLSAQAEACYRGGALAYASGDRARAVVANRRGCALGDARACNNLGDALQYGEGVERDLSAAAALFARACRLGEALGCANLGQVTERAASSAAERARAAALYRRACAVGEVYGCLHAEMLAAMGPGAGAPGPATLARWQRACDAGRDARACAFAGVLYEDGPDGLARDVASSLRAMRRGCELGEPRACDWLEDHHPEP
jgi:TPR repeat protein